jgi:AcrR family transcriptional regulator
VHRGFGAFRTGPETLTAEVTTSLVAAPGAPRPQPVAVAPAEAPPGATADARRAQIFRAACEAIARKGYDKTSVREIAAAAGLPIATLYLYVRNKEDILHMITQGLMEDIFRDFRENLSAEGTAGEKLARAIGSYLGYVDRNRKYINLVYRETRSLSRENREKIFAIERDFARLWQEILEEGVAAGEFEIAEPALTAELVYFLCNVWSIRHWTVGRFDGALVRAELTRFALRGIEKGGRKRNG